MTTVLGKVYLARSDGSSAPGSLTWKFSIPDGFVSGAVKLLVNSTTFKTGAKIET